MSCAVITAAMQQAGIRRLAVIAGDAEWAREQAGLWQQALPGDWITLSNASDLTPHVAPAALRTLLGREFTHALFDARHGFHAEAFAALAGTLRAGSWLLLLTPPWESWATAADADSLRWADVAEPIATPRFIRRLQQLMLADEEVLLQRQHLPVRQPAAGVWPRWQCQAPQQQAAILAQLQAIAFGVAVVTAPRGRGKSALAGMLARNTTHALVTAPAKVSTAVLAQFAGEQFSFMAPDAILQQPVDPLPAWLIVDEAAAIPAPLLQQLVARFPRVLLTTTVQGYEGTGRGFLLRFCATLPDVRYFTLDEPLRWSAQDPLEQWLNRALLFEEADRAAPASEITLYRAMPDADPAALEAGYRLLASAHYRTSPLDLRRLLDAPGMQLWLAGAAESVAGALWLVEEGGLDAELAQAVWAGTRRPRGNLVAQSLAAHAGFSAAATLRSLRISRIAVTAARRQQGTGRALVAQARQQAAGCDFLSVSFGYTAALWRFWHACGFTLVRVGSQREASSGCYAAMAICALTPAGKQLQAQAAQRLARDAVWLNDLIDLPLPDGAGLSQNINEEDVALLAGFAWAQRPFEASYAVLQRLVRIQPQPLMQAILLQKQTLSEAGSSAGLSGRKAVVQRLRQETAEALERLDPQAAQAWQQRLTLLQ